MWSFPRLKRPTVFIAAPGDLAHLRRATARMLGEMKSRSADDHGIVLFDWVIDMAADGFMDWIPAQGQIPLPSDKLCRAVVCMFGERIGTPLPPDFDLTAIGDLAAFASEQRVVHPWNSAVAESGGFSLTGTVFEFLAALHANAGGAARSEQELGNPPVLLLFVGREDLDGDLDPLDMGWGNYRLDAEARARFESSYPKAWRTQYAKWQKEEYLPQLVQLRNFFRFVRSRGIVPRVVRDDREAQEAIRSFLGRSLRLGADGARRDPFLGLEAFDVEDQMVFFGRKEERNRMIAAFKVLWDDPDRPTFFGIIGGSGVGKSSMLKAGLISSLCDSLSPDLYRACIVRPGEIPQAGLTTWAGGRCRRTGDALQELVARILDALECGEAIEPTQRRLATVRDEHRGMEALEMVTACLPADHRLLIAFDQFEELVDPLSDPDLAARWHPVVDLIRAAARDRRVGVLYTLQENRQDSLVSNPILGELFRTGEARSLSFPTQGLDEIIGEPFRSQGLQLEPALSRELHRRIMEFAAFQDSTTQGSLLPLVSVMLKRIYTERGRMLQGHDRTPLVSVGGPQALERPVASTGEHPENMPVLRLADCEDLLDVGDAIAELAQQAMESAKTILGPVWSESDLGGLLRTLVRRQGRDDRLSLPPAPMPSKAAGRRLAKAFLARRLLLPTEEGRIRLVHEALLHHWPPAASWLEEERSLLDDSILLGLHADAWDRGGRSPEQLRPDDLERAAMLLHKWMTNLSPQKGYSLSPEDARLRDYGLALLSQAHPRKTVDTSTCMHVATAYSESSLVRKYLNLDREVAHLVREDGRMPLFNPCFTGAEDLVAMLLGAGADPDTQDNAGWRPLHAAVTEGNIGVIELLLEAGAAIESRGPNGITPLEIAAREGRAEVLTLMLERGADPGSTTNRGWTPLHTAVDRGHLAAARALLDHGADIQAQSDLPLGKGPAALHLAAQNGSVELAKLLIDRGANLEALLEARPTWNVKVSAEVSKELAAGSTAAGVELGRDAATPLHMAIRWGTEEVAWLLLEAGADPNAQRGILGTPLHAAAQQANVPLVAMLLGHGADPNAPRADGLTPLHYARINGDGDVLTLMLEDVRSQGSGGDIEVKLPVELALAGGRSLPWYDWVTVDHDMAADFVNQLHPIDGRWELAERRTHVAYAWLPWYRDVALIEVTDPSWDRPNLRIYFLALNDHLYRLNGTSPLIHEVNERARLHLEADHALEYLRFFFFFVRGEEGPFYILEDANDPLLPPYVDPTTRQLLEHLVRPAELERSEGGDHMCHATVFYSDALFRITFEVHRNGRIYLKEDKPIVAGLPFRIHAPLG